MVFQNESVALPNGFTQEDVNMDAPKIYNDMFCLIYVNHMAKVGMLGFSGFLSMSAEMILGNFLPRV